MTYVDHSPSALVDEDSIEMTQRHLVTLGHDLGRSGADGDWGSLSQTAAAQWQAANGYEPTGDITVRQFDVLEAQANDPSIYNQIRLSEFYNNFDQTALAHLDPVRAGIVTQALSHMGAQELGETNTGAAVEQYFESDPRIDTGGAWCAAFGSWVFDRVEQYAGVETDSFMNGSMRVGEIRDHIAENSPEAFRNITEGLPEAGDMMLTHWPDGTKGHFAIVLGAEETPDGTYIIRSVDGNSGDAVSYNETEIFYDEASGNNYMVQRDDNGDPLVYNVPIDLVDISQLPNYNSLNSAFNLNGGFVPTPSADPSYQLNQDDLDLAEEALRASAPQPLPKLPVFDVQPAVGSPTP